jgi:outer membrane protein TolC
MVALYSQFASGQSPFAPVSFQADSVAADSPLAPPVEAAANDPAVPENQSELPLPETVAAANQTLLDVVDETDNLIGSNELTLADVIASVYQSFPMIQQARLERDRAAGMILEGYGAYDTKVKAYTLNEPIGFYENYRQGIDIARQTWWGTYLATGYRLGRGVFEPWYQERQTNEAGEFKVAMGMPLLQGRAIDAERVAIFQANVDRQAAEPLIQQAILDFSREAAIAYWDWVAAGAVLEAQRELLELAETRGQQFETGVEAGKFAEIDLLFNRGLIAERNAKYLESDQKFRSAAFKLSLFLRNEAGQPLVAPADWCPDHFPQIQDFESDFQQDLSNALARRPEPRLLQLEIRKLRYDIQLAQNNLLPRVDVISDLSQDVGERTSSKNDKGDIELNIGVTGEVPIQRRKPRGKLQQTNAKIQQVSQKLRIQSDYIAMDLQIAYNALDFTAQQFEQAEKALAIAVETLARYRIAFQLGKADLIYINLLETKLNETEIKVVEVQRNWYLALADMQAALGLDPMDASIQLAAIPKSTRAGPGDLPKVAPINNEDFLKDWQRHALE